MQLADKVATLQPPDVEETYLHDAFASASVVRK